MRSLGRDLRRCLWKGWVRMVGSVAASETRRGRGRAATGLVGLGMAGVALWQLSTVGREEDRGGGGRWLWDLNGRWSVCERGESGRRGVGIKHGGGKKDGDDAVDDDEEEEEEEELMAEEEEDDEEMEDEEEEEEEEEGRIVSNGDLNAFKERLERVRLSTGAQNSATVARTKGGVVVRFTVRDDADLFEMLLTALGGAVDTGGSKKKVKVDVVPSGKDVEVMVANATCSSSLYIHADNFEIYIFHPQIGPFSSRFEVRRFGQFFSEHEMDGIVRAYEISQLDPALRKQESVPTTSTRKLEADRPPPGTRTRPDYEQIDLAKKKLDALGVSVFVPHEKLAWDDLAGYDSVKTQIEDTLTLALTRPDVYDHIARKTRKKFQTSRPRAVLFEGPPGCGKTTTGKILASQVGLPFVHVPLEAVLSKWYGDSERQFSKVLTTASELGPALIFLDEADALGTSRDKEIHEASRRLLSILLRHIDGMEGQQPSVIIAATNRKSDLDRALLSRFDVIISFDLPDETTRAKVFALYAKHLKADEIAALVFNSADMSGRNILDACKDAERKCAGRFIREGKNADTLPTLDDYLTVLRHRSQTGHY